MNDRELVIRIELKKIYREVRQVNLVEIRDTVVLHLSPQVYDQKEYDQRSPPRHKHGEQSDYSDDESYNKSDPNEREYKF